MQGVGFRYFAWRLATRLALRGWVRNLPDGRVELVAEGDPDRLAQLEVELKRGPPMASVTNLRAAENLDQDPLRSAFEIR